MSGQQEAAVRTFEPEISVGGEGWLAVEMVPGEVHTVPVGDAVLHEPDDCICVPEVVPVERQDGSVGYVVNHSRLADECRGSGAEQVPMYPLPAL